MSILLIIIFINTFRQDRKRPLLQVQYVRPALSCALHDTPTEARIKYRLSRRHAEVGPHSPSPTARRQATPCACLAPAQYSNTQSSETTERLSTRGGSLRLYMYLRGMGECGTCAIYHMSIHRTKCTAHCNRSYTHAPCVDSPGCGPGSSISSSISPSGG